MQHAKTFVAVVGALVGAGLWLRSCGGAEPDVRAALPQGASENAAVAAATQQGNATVPALGGERLELGEAPFFLVRVVEGTTRVPIVAATVDVEASSFAVTSANGARLFRGVTAADGTCAVPASRSTLTVRASRDGFVPKSLPGVDPVAGDTVVVALVAETASEVLVRDAATKQPIAGARVLAQPSEFRPVFHRNVKDTRLVVWSAEREAGVTDHDGIAKLRGLGAGTWDLAVVAAGRVGEQLLDLEAPFEPSPLVVELASGHELEVALVDEGDRPQPDWRVQFRVLDRTWIVRTDDRGIARSPGFPAGTAVKVLVPREDLDTAAMFAEAVLRPVQSDVVMPHAERLRLVVSRARANAFHVAWTKGSPTDRLTLEVLQEMTPRGHGLSQRLVVAASEGGADVGAATSGDRGRFVVQAVGEESGLWRSEPFFLIGEGTTVMLREVTPRSGLVHGRVLDANGSPARDAEVTFAATAQAVGQLEPSMSPGTIATVVASTKSLDDGMFVRDGLLPGRHRVEARVGDRVAVATVEVGADTALDLVLAATGRIRGEVLHAGIGGERVVVRCAPRGWSRTIGTDLDGRFAVSGLPAGSYTAAVMPPPTFRPWNAAGDLGTPELRVEVGAGEEAVCVLDAALACRRLTVEVSGLTMAGDLQIERLHPYDRQATQVWRLHRPVPRGGVVFLESLDPEADYVVVVRGGGQLLGWVEVPRGAERVHVRCDTATAVVSVADVPETTDLVLVPVGGAGVVARESLLRGTRGPQAIEFRDVPVGAYRLVAGKHTDHVGPFTQSMLVQVGAGPLQVRWHPAK